ncbi:hypothetical protein ACN38_g8599 [Penicillium nordicum]|uniref:Uncharacterized protein n=1 Tax=Penicillium nordicum TaxID=229535 RepID=A0A0M9WDB0_9EURO|nr:hypothetical protein ACN38_g8599 [Penicillium nordicum]
MIIIVPRPRPGNRLVWRLSAGAALLQYSAMAQGLDLMYSNFGIVSCLCSLVMSFLNVYKSCKAVKSVNVYLTFLCITEGYGKYTV